MKMIGLRHPVFPLGQPGCNQHCKYAETQGKPFIMPGAYGNIFPSTILGKVMVKMEKMSKTDCNEKRVLPEDLLASLSGHSATHTQPALCYAE